LAAKSTEKLCIKEYLQTASDIFKKNQGATKTKAEIASRFFLDGGHFVFGLYPRGASVYRCPTGADIANYDI
jgi:hypothetical protein